MDLGIPEAFWQLKVTDMQLLVTIDTHGRSWHAEIEQTSAIRLRKLLGQQT
jgi:tartrate dehydratase beta subunit/fumarate hydratase class I family protein